MKVEIAARLGSYLPALIDCQTATQVRWESSSLRSARPVVRSRNNLRTPPPSRLWMASKAGRSPPAAAAQSSASERSLPGPEGVGFGIPGSAHATTAGTRAGGAGATGYCSPGGGARSGYLWKGPSAGVGGANDGGRCPRTRRGRLWHAGNRTTRAYHGAPMKTRKISAMVTVFGLFAAAGMALAQASDATL